MESNSRKVPSFTDFVGRVNVPQSKVEKKVELPEKRKPVTEESLDSGIIGVLERMPIAPQAVPESSLPYDSTYVDNLKKGKWNAKPEPMSEPEPVVEETEPVQEEVPEPELEPVIEPINESIMPDFEGYRVIRDRDENFECKISVEGTTLTEARARLVMDSEPWNLTFYGKIYPDGRCVVPIKKGFPLGEGTTGKIRLEVIAEDQLFVGWESEFLVEVSKKLSVQLKEQKKVKVSFGKEE